MLVYAKIPWAATHLLGHLKIMCAILKKTLKEEQNLVLQYSQEVRIAAKINKTRLISIVSNPIKLISGQTNFEEKFVQKIWVKKVFGQKKLWVEKIFGFKKIWVKKNFWPKKFGQTYF